jgi:TonB-dependent SusC/RagA subfamily outer membrane receptor
MAPVEVVVSGNQDVINVAMMNAGTQSQNERENDIEVSSVYLRDNTSIIRIEGSTSPLYIVDGKEASEFDIKNFNPDNIQSISVFKGQTAIEQYGEKGKNGVIVITTKK